MGARLSAFPAIYHSLAVCYTTNCSVTHRPPQPLWSRHHLRLVSHYAPISRCGGSNRVWNLLHYGDASLGLLVTCPLRIPQVWRGDGPQVDSVSVFYYYHLFLDITTSIVIYVFIYVGWCMWVILLYPHVYNSTSTSRIYEI